MHAGKSRELRIFFSVGEPSGDLHGANLIRAIRAREPGVECVGYGGPHMAEAGCELHADLTQLAVMWIVRAILNLHKFLDLASRADRYFRHHRPDAVVLIDYPGFNWWIARRAKAHGIPVFYYTPPQIWAWLSYRVKKMRRFVDHVLCSLPFEQGWFASRGCRAAFVGHPFFDEVRRRELDAAFLAEQAADRRPLVAILPGSRTQEVTNNLPTFLKAAAKLRRAVPGVRFAVAAFKPHQAEMARAMIAESNLDPSGVPVYVGRTPELMQAAACCLACSGSVSLELLYHLKPTVIGYRTSRAGHWFQHFARNVPYITLVNLLSTGRVERDREAERTCSPQDDPNVLFPEFLSCDDRSTEMAERLAGWLTDDQSRRALVERLRALRDRVGAAGASERGAAYLLEHLGRPQKVVPRPHYLLGRRTDTIPADALGGIGQI
jgi:lipid-A-disaccharide synthase